MTSLFGGFLDTVPTLVLNAPHCRSAFIHLCSIAKFRNILSQSDADKLIHASLLLVGTVVINYYYQIALKAP